MTTRADHLVAVFLQHAAAELRPQAHGGQVGDRDRASPLAGSERTTICSMSASERIQPTPRIRYSALPLWITRPPTEELERATAANNSPSVTP